MAQSAAPAQAPERPIKQSASSVLGVRAFALLIDLILLSVLLALLGAVFGIDRVTSGAPLAPGADGMTRFTTSMSLDWLWGSVVGIAYFTICELLLRATPGKLLVGLRVVAADGSTAPAAAVVMRNLMRLIDSLPLMYLVGGITVLVTTDHRRLGDMVASTSVVAVAAAPPADLRRAKSRLRIGALAGLLLAGIAFSGAFSYFGRPPLVIESLRNTGGLNFVSKPITSYELGTPRWGRGTVTYPVHFHLADGRDCAGQLGLEWRGVSGWSLSNAQTNCGV